MDVNITANEAAKLREFGTAVLDARKRRNKAQADIEDGGYVPENARKVGGNAADTLRSLVGRIEKLEEERKALASDIKDIYTEAKSAGFDIKVLRELIRIRRKDVSEQQEMEDLLDVYRKALDR